MSAGPLSKLLADTCLSGCSKIQTSQIQRAAEGGGKLRGGEAYRKFGEKPLPKNVFGPPTYDTFPPPLFWRLSVISPKRKRHRPDQPQFLRPPKVVLESTLCSTFSPPQIHAIRFAPPSAAAQQINGSCCFVTLAYAKRRGPLLLISQPRNLRKMIGVGPMLEIDLKLRKPGQATGPLPKLGASGPKFRKSQKRVRRGPPALGGPNGPRRVKNESKGPLLSAPKSQRFLRFAIAMPIADPRNRAISETRESNAAMQFKGAMESR